MSLSSGLGSVGPTFQSYDGGVDRVNEGPTRPGNRTVSNTSSTSGNVTTQIKVTENIKQIASNELVSIDIIPFIRAQKIYFRATGLRPSCRHFAFFDRKPVDVWCRQENYETISNDPTEYGNQYNNATEHPEGTTELFSNSNGVLEGSFFLPNTDTISFRTGEREFRLVDISVYNLDTAISTAFAIFTANGLIENRRDVYLKTTTILTTRTTTTYVTRSSPSGGGGGNGGGPTSYEGSKGRTFSNRQDAIWDGGTGRQVDQRANSRRPSSPQGENKNGDPSPSSSPCFLTTACCDMFGRPDDGIELSTLRQFRDGWLINQNDGKNDIDEYRMIAPEICRILDNDSRKNQELLRIYFGTILPCVFLIKIGANRLTWRLYKNMVKRLRKKYLS